MKVSTLTQTVVVKNAVKPAEVLRTLLASVLATTRPKARQDSRREQHTKAPRVGPKGPQQSGSCVILVISFAIFVLVGYRQKAAPRQPDMAWASRESLYEARIFPIP